MKKKIGIIGLGYVGLGWAGSEVGKGKKKLISVYIEIFEVTELEI